MGSTPWFHVIQRPAPRRRFLQAPGNPADWLAKLGRLESGRGVEVHAFCLLGSHAHLLLRAGAGEEALAGALSDLDERSGLDRAFPVGPGRPVAEVSRYIHLNPVRAGLARRPDGWPHSSLRGYLDFVSGPRWLRTAAVLGQFGGSGARARYEAWVLRGLDKGSEDPWGRPKLRPLLPGDEVDHRLRREGRRRSERIALATIAQAVAAVFETAPDSLRLGRTREPWTALARGALVHAARSRGGWDLPEIAVWLGDSGTTRTVLDAVRFQEAAADDPTLLERLEGVIVMVRGNESR